jgi:hypothetical protein
MDHHRSLSSGPLWWKWLKVALPAEVLGECLWVSVASSPSCTWICTQLQYHRACCLTGLPGSLNMWLRCAVTIDLPPTFQLCAGCFHWQNTTGVRSQETRNAVFMSREYRRVSMGSSLTALLRGISRQGSRVSHI